MAGLSGRCLATGRSSSCDLPFSSPSSPARSPSQPSQRRQGVSPAPVPGHGFMVEMGLWVYDGILMQSLQEVRYKINPSPDAGKDRSCGHLPSIPPLPSPFSPLLGRQAGKEQRSQRREATWALENPAFQCHQKSRSNLTPVHACIIQVPISPQKSCLYFPPLPMPLWGPAALRGFPCFSDVNEEKSQFLHLWTSSCWSQSQHCCLSHTDIT